MLHPIHLLRFTSLLILINCSISYGQNRNNEDPNKHAVWSFGVGPQFSMTDWDKGDIMVGPNIILNALIYKKAIVSLDLHGAMTTKWGLFSAPDYTVNYLGSVSILFGGRIYETEKSAFQIEGGFSYGYLYYIGKVTSGEELFTHHYDDKYLNFGGTVCKISYRHLIKKIVGYEIYISTNLHVHPEMAFGFNFRLGRMR